MATSDTILQMATEITKSAVEASGNFGITGETHQNAVIDLLEKVTTKLNELSKKG